MGVAVSYVTAKCILIRKFQIFNVKDNIYNVLIVQRKKFPTLPRMKTILSEKPNSLEQISVSLKTLQ